MNIIWDWDVMGKWMLIICGQLLCILAFLIVLGMEVKEEKQK